MAATDQGEVERKMKNELFHMAMKGEWDEVVKIYRSDKRAQGQDHKAKITKSGDTALHIAVSDDKEDIVERLITEITSPGGGGKEALEIKNEQGNTLFMLLHQWGVWECVNALQKLIHYWWAFVMKTARPHFSWQRSMVKKKPSFVFLEPVRERIFVKVIPGGMMVRLFFMLP
jgi:hypothetical protein